MSRFVLCVLAAIMLAPSANAQQWLGVLQGRMFIANDGFGSNQTFGRYQGYDVRTPAGFNRARLEWRGPGPFREYDVYDAQGLRSGSIEFFGSRFELFDRTHRRVGSIEGAWGWQGRYQVHAVNGQVVGYMDSPFGDGSSFNIRGDQVTVELFAKIGLPLGAPREESFARLHPETRVAPVPEAGRFFGDSAASGMIVTDTLHRFATYRLTAQGQPAGRLELQPLRGSFRVWNAYSAGGAQTGSIGGWTGSSSFALRDPKGTLVGLMSHPNNAPPGELHVYDLSGRDVGALCDMSGDGAVLSVRGGNEVAAIFKKIGLALIPPGI